MLDIENENFDQEIQPVLTKDLVFDVCSKLESENKRITQISVRDLIGFGSFTTIAPWIKEYKNKNTGIDISEHQKVIPDALQKKLFDMGTEFWNYASVIAEKERQAFRDDLADERKKIELELLEKDELIQYLESVNDKVLKDKNVLEMQVLDLASDASQLETYKNINKSLQDTIDKYMSFAESYKLEQQEEKKPVKKPVKKTIKKTLAKKIETTDEMIDRISQATDAGMKEE